MLKRRLPPNRNLTGISYYVDNHVIDSKKAKLLRKFHLHGWIYLQVSDTVLTEILSAQSKLKKWKLVRSISIFPISMGPTVLGSSIQGFSLIGSEVDKSRIEKIHVLLWPNHTFDSDNAIMRENSKARTRVRDTLIVSNTIRYSISYLVTEDKEILKAQSRIRSEFSSFYAIDINAATLESIKAVARARTHSKESLPRWPSIKVLEKNSALLGI